MPTEQWWEFYVRWLPRLRLDVDHVLADAKQTSDERGRGTNLNQLLAAEALARGADHIERAIELAAAGRLDQVPVD